MIDYLSKFSMKGKTAFVAGAAGLIGSEISRAFASAGAKTILLDIDNKKGNKLKEEIVNAGFEACFEDFDITELTNINTFISALATKYKSVDVWVNVAYPRTADWGKSIEDLDIESWRKNVDMHLNSYAWTSRQVALVMKELKTKGTIINFGSIYGIQGNDFTIYENTGINPPMAYSAIKGGIINLSRHLASYFGPHGIRVNNICPGGIFDSQNKTFVKNYEKKVPLNRMGTPDEIASVTLFLASEAASYINGATIIVDGGWTII